MLPCRPPTVVGSVISFQKPVFRLWLARRREAGVAGGMRAWPPPNASVRVQWVAILASPLHELTGFYLAVDFLTVGEAVGEVLWRMRCSGGRGGRVLAVWLETSDPQYPGQAAAGTALGPEARGISAGGSPTGTT